MLSILGNIYETALRFYIAYFGFILIFSSFFDSSFALLFWFTVLLNKNAFLIFIAHIVLVSFLTKKERFI
jgi:hypothetical protein